MSARLGTPRHHTLLRRVSLFLTLLMSGGLLIFPRLPLLMAILLLCLAISGDVRRVRRELLPVVGVLAGILLLTLLRPQAFEVVATLTRYANFVAALALLGVYLRSPQGSLWGDLMAMLPWIAVQAVLTTVLAALAPSLFMTVNVNDTNYQTLLLVFTYHVFLEDSTALPRPDGFFFEPGVFQIYLNLYLYLALFVFRKPQHAALAIVAVLCAQSTTGLLVMLLMLAYAALRELRAVSLRRKLAVTALALILAAPLLGVTVNNLESKTEGENRGSAWAREYDLLTGVGVIGAHPLIGIGFNYSDYYREAQQYSFADTALSEDHLEQRGNSNGLVTLFYSLGIPLGLLFLAGLYRQRLFPHRLLFGTCMMLCLFGEALALSPFFLFLIFSGLATTPRGATGRTTLTGGSSPSPSRT